MSGAGPPERPERQEADRLEQINLQLEQIRQQLRARGQLQDALVKAKQDLKTQAERLEILTKILESGKANVDKLENPGLIALYHMIVGDKQAKLEKERSTYDSLKRHYDTCCKTVLSLQMQIPRMKQTLKALDDLETEHALLLAAKNEAITEAGGVRARKLKDHAEQLAHAWADCQALQEAVQGCLRLRETLDQVLVALSRAGEMDRGGTGGRGGEPSLSAMRVDEARLAARRGLDEFDQLKKRLRDAGEQASEQQPTPDALDHFCSYVDHFFKGMIGVWAMREKTATAIDEVVKIASQTDQLAGHLRRRLSGAKMKAERLAETRHRMIEEL